MQPLHTVLEPDKNLGTGVENFRYDLPVNPMSVVLVTLRALNNCLLSSNYRGGAVSLMSKISNIRSRYRGATIFDGDPVDLAQIYGRFSRWWPTQGQINATDNDTRSVTFPLLFGRRPYDPLECFPATRRGDLTLEIDTAADPTGLDGFDMQIETVELLDATPERFIKVTSSQQIMAAGDVNDVTLPIGNKLLGLLLRGNLFPTGANQTASFAECALQLDNVEVMYSRAFWRGLHAIWARRHNSAWCHDGHTHLVNFVAAVTDPILASSAVGVDPYASGNELATGGAAAITGIGGVQPQPEVDVLQRYGYADFDPSDDLSGGIDTKDAADVQWHVNASALDATASRILPVEYVMVGGAAAGA